MLKIWGRANAVNVQKVLWCAAELDLRFERIDAGRGFGVTDTAAFRALNPNQLVPVIEDHGRVLWESNAIVRYLSRKYGLGSLCPTETGASADSDRWMDWVATLAWPDLRPVLMSLMQLAPEARDADLIESSRSRLSAKLALIDAHLQMQPFVAGNSFTMGDIPLGVLVVRWFRLPIKREPFPAVEEYYHRLQQRSAFTRYADLPLS